MSRFPILAAAFGLASCAPDARDAPAAEERGPVAATIELLSDAPIIGRPWMLVSQEDDLWVVDGSGDPFVHRIDTRSGEFGRSHVRQGSGPGEVSGGVGVAQAPSWDPGALWVWQIRLARHLRIPSFVGADTLYVTNTIEPPPIFLSVAWLGPDLLLGTSAQEERRFILMDSSGSRRTAVASVHFGGDSIPASVRAKAATSSAHLCIPPSGGRFAVYHYTLPVVELFDSTAAATGELELPFKMEAPFVRDDGTWRYQMKSVGYISCSATDSELFLLYSGGQFGGSTPPMVAREVHVYDWTGAFKRSIQFPTPVRAIAVSPSGEMMFASSTETAEVYRITRTEQMR